GQKVEDGEIHFRLSHRGVSYVPIDELTELMLQHARHHASPFGRPGSFNGRVGPVDGYLMNYTAQTTGATLSILKCTAVPTEELVEEPVDKALRTGSRFRLALESSPLGTSAVFWVYNDVFDQFSTFQEFAHSLEFRVAARPMLPDMEISLSPGGVKAYGQ
ncbi:MAG: hypothetical protein KDA96_25820, partial [Planctomycetaceae bacterium]|nr:hypothetical protein [Planctomycetaceae bacterium]